MLTGRPVAHADVFDNLSHGFMCNYCMQLF